MFFLDLVLTFNPYPAEFLKRTCPTFIFGIFHYLFWGCQDEKLKLGGQQYRAWSDCTPSDVQIGPGFILVAKANHIWFQLGKG